MKHDVMGGQQSLFAFTKCSKGNPATLAFFDHSCQNSSFTCSNQQCQCKIQHKSCIKFDLQSLTNKITGYTKIFDPLIGKIQTVFNSLIDLLSDIRDKLMQRFKEEIKQICLNEKQITFMDAVKNGTQTQNINCKFAWDLITGLNKEKKIIKKVNQTQKRIHKLQTDFKSQINHLSLNFTKILVDAKQIQQGIFQESKIVKSADDQRKLCAFFTEKQVLSAQMLYRASQNQFLVSKFFQKCSNIPNTLVLVETEFDKVIGGFTSFSWFKVEKIWQTAGAETTDRSHFLFSLTNNDKLPLTKNHQLCIYRNSDNTWGPLFGGGNDLVIYDKANQKNDSHASIGNSYTNANYTTGDAKVKFAGGDKFKIKEWQVWKVSFK